MFLIGVRLLKSCFLFFQLRLKFSIRGKLRKTKKNIGKNLLNQTSKEGLVDFEIEKNSFFNYGFNSNFRGKHPFGGVNGKGLLWTRSFPNPGNCL